MSPWFVALLDLFLVYFFFGDTILDWVLPRSLNARRQARQLRRQLKGRLHRDRDILAPQHIAGYEAAIARCDAAFATYNDGGKAIAALLSDLADDGKLAAALPAPRRPRWLIANLEVVVVSVGVAFGIRSLLLQPFKIPTGSMQPTLWGIHYVANDGAMPAHPGAVRRFLDYCNFSRRYFKVTAPEELILDSVEPAPSKPLFPNSYIGYATATGGRGRFLVPAAPEDAQKLLHELMLRRGPATAPNDHPLHFQADEVIFDGAMESGDHLFVNRLTLAYHEPRRGDIAVFSTNGITYNGQPLLGDYYIKRLVGLPGDTLVIRKRRLLVRPVGETEFRPLDQYHPAFARIASLQNGYHGHSARPDAMLLHHEGDEYTVPAGHYFMLGDNTDNSLDSRYWGPVPRANLAGSPCFIWWPFGKHFGTGTN